MLRNVIPIIAATFLVLLSAFGSATAKEQSSLRVGITPNYPPMIFKMNENITGVEADLARRLGKELNRPVQFVEMAWDKQITALIEGKIDIIMSGMSITEARKVRMQFTDYYMKSGLVAAMRAEDKGKYQSLESILNTNGFVGAVKDTTGEVFANRNFPYSARKSFVTKAGLGVYELESGRMDIFLHDAPSIIWLVSQNEAKLAGFWQPLNEEYLAWGVRKGDDVFLKQVNAILQRWKQDGTLNEMLRKWLPAKYFERFK